MANVKWGPRTLGSLLQREEQEQAKRWYVGRCTGDNKPAWTRKEWKDGKPYPLQFKDDADWLSHTIFRTNRDGSLHARADCKSSPRLLGRKTMSAISWNHHQGEMVMLDYSSRDIARVRIVKATQKHVYVLNVLTGTTYKVHPSRLTYPDKRGQTGRVMAALERGEKITPENLYHV